MRKKMRQRTGVIREYDMHSVSVRVWYAVIYALCIVMGIIAVFPLIWVVLAGFKDLKEFMSSTSLRPKSFSPEQFKKTWSQLGLAKNYLNSFISVAGSVVCALLFNGLLGYGLSILKPKGYGIVKKLVMLSLLVPATISIVPLFMNIQRLGMGNSFLPLWLSYGANAMYVVLFIQFFESLPVSMIEASRIDGCSALQTFFRIVLPLSKPICAVITIFAVNAAWSDFLLPYLVLRGGQLQTVMVRLFVFSTEQTVNADTMMRSVVFSMIPPIILFILFQKQLTENNVSVGIKG
ncbi:MAG: carbohydrate ABC transporter permease [Lachnospiraceae bacterium]|nr:carbohydrate ABC transporter permease [Lachnospiraceae bacterium]